MSAPDVFRLTSQDNASALWPKLKAFMEQELNNLRQKNDQPLSELDTAGVRGQIRQLKALIELDKDRPIPEVPDQF